MKAVLFDKRTLSIHFTESAPLPQPGLNQVRVKVLASSINPVDSMYNFWGGMISDERSSLAFVLGVDGAGIIDLLGDEANTKWSVGDRVVFHPFLIEGNGTFAEYSLAHMNALVRIPENVTYLEAAATPCAGWTALKALKTKMNINTLNCSSGKSILITGGNGGVGGFAIQLAKHFNLSPIITTCSPKSNDRVKSLGASHTIDYNSSDVAEVAKSVCPEGLDYIVDVIGSDSATSLLSALAYDGHLATIAGVVRRGDPSDSYIGGWTVHDISLGGAAYLGHKPDALADLGSYFLQLVSDKSVDTMIFEVISLPNIIAYLQAGSRTGKVVVDHTL